LVDFFKCIKNVFLSYVNESGDFFKLALWAEVVCSVALQITGNSFAWFFFGDAKCRLVGFGKFFLGFSFVFAVKVLLFRLV